MGFKGHPSICMALGFLATSAVKPYCFSLCCLACCGQAGGPPAAAVVYRVCASAEDGAVKALLLGGFGLRGTLPEILERLEGLEFLQVAGNAGEAAIACNVRAKVECRGTWGSATPYTAST